ncbi:nitrate- and nitrite sensing domain-containing protein [Nocardiopsis alba]|uniref:sensor histidine kinase n=1 Tax=Nocardiopsis alba TaxID=53437 RepID=UPI00366C3E1D
MGQSGGAGSGIRTQLSRIVLIPSITFLALFVMLSSATLAQAVSLRSSVTDGRAATEITTALTALQLERRLSAEYLTAPGEETRRALMESVEETDLALTDVRAVRSTLEAIPDTREGGFLEAVDTVETVRSANLERPGDLGETLDAYTEAIRIGARLYEGSVRGLDDGPAGVEAAATGDLLWAQEGFAHADAVISGVLSENSLDREQQSQVASLIGDADRRLDALAEGSRSEGADAAERIIGSRDWSRAMEITEAVSHYEAPVEIDPFTGEQSRLPEPPTGIGDWRSVADGVDTALAGAVSERSLAVVSAVEAAAARMFTLALGGGIISLFAGTVAYGVAARSAARLTHRLARLKAEALAVARNDLPRIVRRLEEGESVDLDTEMKQLDHGRDEIGQVADAFNIAQRTAIGAAVKQADTRAGVSRVFLGIAHRNQSLVQRQLQLLDRVEREEEDPDLLESLFQLDHLATRGRRHAENLIILGGAQPGRRWRHPVPLVDIMRGAISETDEYARVELASTPDLSLVGAVVADVIHLLAELVENATAYSPPHTDVTIRTEKVPKGVAVEIEDRGLGMTEEALDKANGTLADAPEFDMMTSGTDGRLGLFVVARLAHKHDIGVHLRSSPYGGTRAVVLIPNTLVAPGAAQEPSGAPYPIRMGAPERERLGPADLLSAGAEQRTRAVRPMLRPVPEHPEEIREDRRVEHAPAPLLRQVPDLRPAERDLPVEGGAPAPLPKREARRSGGAERARPIAAARTTGADHGGDIEIEQDNGRVGAGPDREGLPRRRKQASLAPQLRDGASSASSSPPTSTRRTPEQARRMMDAFSAGTRRGRAGDAGADEHGHSSDDQVGAGADDHTGESD